MKDTIYRGEWRCHFCNVLKKTVAYGNVRSLADLTPRGWEQWGLGSICDRCIAEKRHVLPESPPVQP